MIHVTQVLSPFSDFSRISPEVLEMAAARGTRVHAACATIAMGGIPVDVLPEEQGRVDSFCRWWEKVTHVWFVETPMVCEHYGFTGTPDLGVRWAGVDILTDIKTPVTPARTWHSQVSSYLHLAREVGFHFDKGSTLQLDPKGGPPKTIFLEDETRAWAAFLGALCAQNYFGKEG